MSFLCQLSAASEWWGDSSGGRHGDLVTYGGRKKCDGAVWNLISLLSLNMAHHLLWFFFTLFCFHWVLTEVSSLILFPMRFLPHSQKLGSFKHLQNTCWVDMVREIAFVESRFRLEGPLKIILSLLQSGTLPLVQAAPSPIQPSYITTHSWSAELRLGFSLLVEVGDGLRCKRWPAQLWGDFAHVLLAWLLQWLTSRCYWWRWGIWVLPLASHTSQTERQHRVADS